MVDGKTVRRRFSSHQSRFTSRDCARSSRNCARRAVVPWDREQTHESLVPGLLEEAYEVADAIRTNDDANLREELGDFLLQVVMHAQIASEEGRFTIEDVAREIGDKLVRRHPHVFGESEARDTGAVLKQWDAIKRAEKNSGERALFQRPNESLAGPDARAESADESGARRIRLERTQGRRREGGRRTGRDEGSDRVAGSGSDRR